MCYIPWFDEGKYQAKDALSRDWLVGLINALDNNFFPRLIAYHESRRNDEWKRLVEPIIREEKVTDDLKSLIGLVSEIEDTDQEFEQEECRVIPAPDD